MKSWLVPVLIKPPVKPPDAFTLSTPLEVTVNCAALDMAVRPPPALSVKLLTVPLPNNWFALKPTFDVMASVR